MSPRREKKVEFLKVFAERLKQERKKRGWTQPDLAKASGVSIYTIEQYERQLAVPKIDVLLKIAKALDVSIDYLMGRTSMPSVVPNAAAYAILEVVKDAWGPRVLDALYRARYLPTDDKRVIYDLVVKFAEKTKGKPGKQEKEIQPSAESSGDGWFQSTTGEYSKEPGAYYVVPSFKNRLVADRRAKYEPQGGQTHPRMGDSKPEPDEQGKKT